MPETRYIEEYRNSKLVNRIPYEVSDEDLQEEAADARLREILSTPPPQMAVPVLFEGFQLLCKRFGVLEITETESS